MSIRRPDGLLAVANSGLTLVAAAQPLAQDQQEVVADQSRHHPMFRADDRAERNVPGA
jgi:hypothetical protein